MYHQVHTHTLKHRTHMEQAVSSLQYKHAPTNTHAQKPSKNELCGDTLDKRDPSCKLQPIHQSLDSSNDDVVCFTNPN